MSAITVENISKRYLIGHQAEHSDTLRDALAHGVKGLWRRFRQGRMEREDFWALKDVSFTVEPGEVLGVIGRNGAGKSTLLKVLSRITEPTQGSIKIRGRVASLLEVGTGFHPELSGRENIYLNGAILGMTKQEIERRFDEIVAFSEVERFLDTPVKRYSSGMYVRLAFSVAAHLEPEILFVDEVLAVGDAAFQRKCLGKMRSVATHSGRTILFVSHNMEAVRKICSRGLLLKSGQVVSHGEIGSVLSDYTLPTASLSAEFSPRADTPTITRVSVDSSALLKGILKAELGFASPSPLEKPNAGFILSDENGRPVFGTNMAMHATQGHPALPKGVCTLEVPDLPLHSGFYSLSAWLGDANTTYDNQDQAVSFEFLARSHYPNRPSTHVIGPLDISGNWSVSET
jgi:lipopolysaccharide transport system ATP-binding protein